MKTTKTKVDYFCGDSLRQDLRKKTVRGGVTTAFAQMVRLVGGFITVPILTRLLEPDDFGLIAMVMVFTGFAAMFVNAGMSTATVQRDQITQQQVSNLFWLAVGLGLLVTTLTVAISPLIGWVYSEPRLVGITLALATSFVFSGLTIQHQAMLRRGMQFQSLAAADILSFFGGQASGIAWAWAYRDQPYDYWALVIAPVVTAAISMLCMWIFSGWRPTLPRRYAGTRELAVFGANLTLFSFVNYFARNVDYMFIGYVWGKTALGYYERAYRLLMLPVQQLTPTLTAVVVPALSRVQATPAKYREGWRKAAAPLAWASIPIVGLSWCMAMPMITLYFGPSWERTAVLFQALAPAIWASIVGASFSWVFMSWGHVRRLVAWGCINTLGILLALALSIRYGTLAVAHSISAAYVLLRIPGCYLCFSGTPIRMSDFVSAFLYPSLIALIASQIVGLVDRMYLQQLDIVAELVTGTSLYLFIVCTLVLVIPGARNDVAEMKEVLQQLRHARS